MNDLNGNYPAPAAATHPLEGAQAPAEPDIRFGPGETDVMRASWASDCLTWLYEHDRPTFGRMMLGRLGIDGGRKRGPKPADS